ncbi:MAG: zinc ribbon domain-containing protein [Victivallaceae bacterium]|jgi:putative FmdB family regulatory protein|nr:zinc ribbon domain-containing protein [Victivallaceae bacterium]MDD3116699.1 zinc ribbon domain-containing protein [Victivallaceae bacterium]MDD3703790.1 zinc ribbon domain-containing protein [Victivallaceae bacterium]MDD4318375.1 zinc ribbon domain-containing protein [Victivallaceae bacterium]NLK83817.1 zinc ribbon domain-containing protein [Lentisphaerota bacterium]
MPTYEYQCKACGHQMEAFQSIKAEPLKDCPQCHKPELKRKISSGAGIIFKGSGFYQTDYRSSNYNAAKAKDKPAEAAAPAAKETAKPAKTAAAE